MGTCFKTPDIIIALFVLTHKLLDIILLVYDADQSKCPRIAPLACGYNFESNKQ